MDKNVFIIIFQATINVMNIIKINEMYKTIKYNQSSIYERYGVWHLVFPNGISQLNCQKQDYLS